MDNNVDTEDEEVNGSNESSNKKMLKSTNCVEELDRKNYDTMHHIRKQKIQPQFAADVIKEYSIANTFSVTPH